MQCIFSNWIELFIIDLKNIEGIKSLVLKPDFSTDLGYVGESESWQRIRTGLVIWKAAIPTSPLM